MEEQVLSNIVSQYGDSFYLLHSNQFQQNYNELLDSFSKIYPNVNIAYSYKTNYIPKLGKLVNEMGGYAEVVSDMEMEIALRIGVCSKNIIWNGPYKNPIKVEQLLLTGGIVNLDSKYELELIKKLSVNHPNQLFQIGLRVNFDINDGVVSRFGFDVESPEFKKTLEILNSLNNVKLIGLHCHFATRKLETWRSRAKRMLKLIDDIDFTPEIIDLGGGLYGKMDNYLKEQFDDYIPSYNEYADVVATLFADRYKGMISPPLLLIEPGSALVGDCMSLITKVDSIKTVRGKPFATTMASSHNISLGKKNPPLKVFELGTKRKEYNNLDFVGYTCIESDILYRNYSGMLGIGDYLEFYNVGSYSIVFKPPFIIPNFPVIDISDGNIELIKRGEVFDDLFHTYNF